MRVVRPPYRLWIALSCGILAGFRTFLISSSIERPRDFAQVWYAARAILRGQSPYLLIGPGHTFDWPTPFFYPLTAAVVALPLAPLSAFWAPILFSFLAGACLAWALAEHGYPPLLGFLSAPVVFAAELAQWSPLLASATVLTPLSVIYVAKPTIGAAMFAARPTWWAIGGGLLLVAVSFGLEPHWIAAWRHALATPRNILAEIFPHIAPVTLPGGVIALACLARWRRSEARLVAVLACVPQTPMLYEAVPLMLVPRTFSETALLVVLSYVAMTIAAVGPLSRWSWPLAMLLLYLPATVMVLRRENIGPLPPWLEQRIAEWPSWLRGVHG